MAADRLHEWARVQKLHKFDLTDAALARRLVEAHPMLAKIALQSELNARTSVLEKVQVNHGRSHDRRTLWNTTITIGLASAEIGAHHGIHTSGDPRPSDSLVSGPQDSLTSHTLGARVAWGEPSISAVGAATHYSKSGGSVS